MLCLFSDFCGLLSAFGNIPHAPARVACCKRNHSAVEFPNSSASNWTKPHLSKHKPEPKLRRHVSKMGIQHAGAFFQDSEVLIQRSREKPV